jgi:Protein of unknown function (DUF2946)
MHRFRHPIGRARQWLALAALYAFVLQGMLAAVAASQAAAQTALSGSLLVICRSEARPSSPADLPSDRLPGHAGACALCPAAAGSLAPLPDAPAVGASARDYTALQPRSHTAIVLTSRHTPHQSQAPPSTI